MPLLPPVMTATLTSGFFDMGHSAAAVLEALAARGRSLFRPFAADRRLSVTAVTEADSTGTYWS
jgi:hypothetical protein